MSCYMNSAAYGEPLSKKLKCSINEDQEDQLPREHAGSTPDPIFNQFRNNKLRMFQLKHALDALKLGLDRLKLCMMKIVVLNACAPVPFTMATVETETHKEMERDDGVIADSFAVGTIFADGMFILENYFETGALPKNQELRQILAKLLIFLSETDHTVLLEKKPYLEIEWSVIVAQHLFSKLTVNNDYIIDLPPIEKCPCKAGDDLIIKNSDSSFGLLDGWLGPTDILIEDNLPVVVGTNTDEIPDEQSEAQSVSSTEIKEKSKSNKECQLLAQTIVFSFIQSKYNKPKIKNCLVPGIGIDTKDLLVYFYDCENDLLLGSTYLETFSSDYLAVENVVFLWLTLNYRFLCSGPDKFMKKYPSGFAKLTGDHYEKYRNEVKLPAHRQFPKGKTTPWYRKLVFPMKETSGSHIELVQPNYS